MNVSGEFWGRFDTWAGPTFGVILLCVGAFLMLKGATKIKLLSFLTGCAIGQLSSAFLWSEIGDFTSLSESDFILAATFGCGVLIYQSKCWTAHSVFTSQLRYNGLNQSGFTTSHLPLKRDNRVGK